MPGIQEALIDALTNSVRTVATVSGAVTNAALADVWDAINHELRTSPLLPYQGAFADSSSSITSGGVAQTAVPANANRRYLLVQNCSSGDLWINFTTPAVLMPPSLKVTAGLFFRSDPQFVSTEAVSIIGATTGQAFTLKQG